MTIHAALNLVLLDYRVKGKRSLPDAAARVRHLKRLLKDGELARVTCQKLLVYASARQEERVQGATINREIAMLRRACTLAKIAWPVPEWEKLPESEPRQGRIDGEQYRNLVGELAPWHAQVARFLYYTGWRVNEALGLTWRDVDLEAGTLRLPARLSKNKTARTIPIIPQLRAVLEAQAETTRSEFVFHYADGRAISYFGFYHAFCAARTRAGVKRAIPHDFRRTAATKLVKEAKVDRRTAMRMTGHLTESAFVRYEIEDDAELRAAAAKFSKVVA